MADEIPQDAVANTIRARAAIDPGYIARLIQIESGGDPNAQTGNEAEVYVVSPLGLRGSIPREQLAGAIKQGYRLEGAGETRRAHLKEEYGDSEGQAFVQGAARSITLGGSDILLDALTRHLDLERGDSRFRIRSQSCSLLGEVEGSDHARKDCGRRRLLLRPRSSPGWPPAPRSRAPRATPTPTPAGSPG